MKIKFSDIQQTTNSSDMQRCVLFLCKLTGVDNGVALRHPHPAPQTPKQFLKSLPLVLSTKFQKTVPCQTIHSEQINNKFTFLQAVRSSGRQVFEGCSTPLRKLTDCPPYYPLPVLLHKMGDRHMYRVTG